MGESRYYIETTPTIMVIIMMVKGSGNDSTNGAYNQPRFLITSIYIYDLHVIESHLNPLRVCMREHSPERIDRDSDGGFGSELCQSLPDYRRFFRVSAVVVDIVRIFRLLPKLVTSTVSTSSPSRHEMHIVSTWSFKSSAPSTRHSSSDVSEP